jgi:hypothetical protein
MAKNLYAANGNDRRFIYIQPRCPVGKVHDRVFRRAAYVPGICLAVVSGSGFVPSVETYRIDYDIFGESTEENVMRTAGRPVTSHEHKGA